MRGSYSNERKSSSAGVSRSKLAAEARKKKLDGDKHGDTVFDSSALKSALSQGDNGGSSLARKWSKYDGMEDDNDGGDDGPGKGAEGFDDGASIEDDDAHAKKSSGKKKGGRSGDEDKGKEGDLSTILDEDVLERLSSSHADERKESLAVFLRVVRNSVLTSGVQDCLLTSMMDTLRGALSRSINRLHSEEQEDEAVPTMHLVCILGLVVGPDDDEFFEAFEAPLKKIVECSSVGETVQNLALFTLAFVSYICSSDTLAETLEYIEDLILNGPHEITDLPYLQACKSWILLSGALEQQEAYVLRKSRSGLFGAVSSILENSFDAEGRTISGTCLAYLFEVAADFHSHAHEQQSFSGISPLGTAEEEATPGSGDPIPGEVEEDGFDSDEEEDRRADHHILTAALNMTNEDVSVDASRAMGKLLTGNDGLVERTLATLKAITKDSSKRVSKKDRKEQRAVFRDIESRVFDLTSPKEKVRFSGATVEVNSMQALTFLDSLRSVLGNGFQGALRSFPVLCDILNVQRLDPLDEVKSATRVAKGSKEEKKRMKARREGANDKKQL